MTESTKADLMKLAWDITHATIDGKKTGHPNYTSFYNQITGGNEEASALDIYDEVIRLVMDRYDSIPD